MKRIFLIAQNDLRLFLKDKAAYFWLFGAPLLFAFFMGMNKGPGSPSSPKPAVLIENKDAGFMGKILVEQLGVEGLRTNVTDAQRGLRIPTNFTASVLAKKPVKVEYFQLKESASDAGFMTEARLVRTLIAVNSHLIEHSSEGELTEGSLRKIIFKPNPVALDSSFGSRKPIPAGFNQSIPGVLVMFVMMNLLIFGGTTVASERREGVLRRFMVHPVRKIELIYGKIAALLGLGLVQICFVLLIGALFMNFQLGAQYPLVLLVLLIYGWAAGSLGVLIGSIIERDDKIVGLCVLATMVMAALGGCWWPLEITPDSVQRVAHITPVAWALGALHQLISFGGGLREILTALLVLIGFAGAANFAAVRWFKI